MNVDVDQDPESPLEPDGPWQVYVATLQFTVDYVYAIAVAFLLVSVKLLKKNLATNQEVIIDLCYL